MALDYGPLVIRAWEFTTRAQASEVHQEHVRRLYHVPKNEDDLTGLSLFNVQFNDHCFIVAIYPRDKEVPDLRLPDELEIEPDRDMAAALVARRVSAGLDAIARGESYLSEVKHHGRGIYIDEMGREVADG